MPGWTPAVVFWGTRFRHDFVMTMGTVGFLRHAAGFAGSGSGRRDPAAAHDGRSGRSGPGTGAQVWRTDPVSGRGRASRSAYSARRSVTARTRFSSPQASPEAVARGP